MVFSCGRWCPWGTCLIRVAATRKWCNSSPTEVASSLQTIARVQFTASCVNAGIPFQRRGQTLGPFSNDWDIAFRSVIFLFLIHVVCHGWLKWRHTSLRVNYDVRCKVHKNPFWRWCKCLWYLLVKTNVSGTYYFYDSVAALHYFMLKRYYFRQRTITYSSPKVKC